MKIKIYQYCSLNFSCSFGSVETWSLTLRDEHALRVFENRALRRIFRSKRQDFQGELDGQDI
jgi:uncharacterized SAM-binding protein YcdF (DUF218 family)